jgi:hypothetical protein
MTAISKSPSELIYLSSPYSHEDIQVKHLRYRAALLTVAHYLHEGRYLYSPILHNHPVACYRDLATAQEWLEYDYVIMDRCDRVWVLEIEGWNLSSGVRAEMYRAESLRKPVSFIDPVYNEKDLLEFRDFAGVCL